jgi:hypothetical protein
MGAFQERAAFFNATLLVVTRHPGGPLGRMKIHPALPRFALFSFIYVFISSFKKINYSKFLLFVLSETGIFCCSRQRDL